MFEEFTPISKSDWLDKVIRDTKGKRSLEDFYWSLDGLTVSPFYHQDDRDTPMPNLRSKQDNNWEIGTSFLVTNPQKTNQEALAALASGAQALWFIFTEKPTLEVLQSTLKDIQHEWITTHFQAPNNAFPDLVDHFLTTLRAKKQVLAKIPSFFSTFSEEKKLPISLEAYRLDLPLATFCTISVGKLNVVEDLVKALQAANQYLIQVAEAKAGLSFSVPNLQFVLPLSDDYFPFIAKVRALKVLAQQIGQAWKLPDIKISISAELDPATMTEDENYNRIKMTNQAMAAVTAGVDRLFLSNPKLATANNDFSRRIALNIQHLIQQESVMNRVADPAAGSYFIDHLTKEIAEKAWALFQQKNTLS